MAKRNLKLCLLVAMFCSACAVFMTIAMHHCMCWQRPQSTQRQAPIRPLLIATQPRSCAQGVSAVELRMVAGSNDSITAQRHKDREQRRPTMKADDDAPFASALQLAPQRQPTGYTYDMAALAQRRGPAYVAVDSVRHPSSPELAPAGKG